MITSDQYVFIIITIFFSVVSFLTFKKYRQGYGMRIGMWLGKPTTMLMPPKKAHEGQKIFLGLIMGLLTVATLILWVILMLTIKL